MVQLMPLPLHHLLLCYYPVWFKISGTVLPAAEVVLEKRLLNGCLSVYFMDVFENMPNFTESLRRKFEKFTEISSAIQSVIPRCYIAVK